MKYGSSGFLVRTEGKHRSKPFAAMLGCLALTSFLLGGCNEDLLNPMADRQPKFQPYQKTTLFDDGLTMRKPPAGTVPTSRVTKNPALNEGKVDGPNGLQYVTTIPLAVDEEFMALGEKRYTHTCGVCHGPLGDGDSPVATQMALKPPPSLHDFADRPPGYIYEVATHGHGLMAAYNYQLSNKERWAVTAYVRALQLAHLGTLDDVPADQRAQLRAMPAHNEEAPQ